MTAPSTPSSAHADESSIPVYTSDMVLPSWLARSTSQGTPQAAPTPAQTREQELAATYDSLVEEVARLRARAEEDTDSGDSDRSLPDDDDDDGGHMLWFHDYLEFVLLQRACSSSRAARGLPAIACTRHAPCDQCNLHDGSYVPSGYWHTMGDEELEAHLAQYRRIRHRLPPWRSSRPPHIPPPRLHFGRSVYADSPTAAPPHAHLPRYDPGVTAHAPTPDNAHAPDNAAPVGDLPALGSVPAAENAAPAPGADSGTHEFAAIVAEPLVVALRGHPIPLRLLLNGDELEVLDRNIEESRELWTRYLALPSTASLLTTIFDCTRVHGGPMAAIAFVLPQDFMDIVSAETQGNIDTDSDGPTA